MKKAYLALAVAAAMPAAASAQTSITLTGSIDGSLEWSSAGANPTATNPKGAGTDIKVNDGVMSPSRVAIIGSEDIGGGLKGIFNIEHRFSVDTGALRDQNKFWQAQSWVGVEGGFGGIRFGRQYTTMFRGLAPGDLTGYTFYYNAFGLANTAGRWDNTVEYRTPTLGGFVGYAQYAPGEAPGTTGGLTPTAQGDAYGAGFTGAFGPIGIGGGYQLYKRAGLPQVKQYGVSANGKVSVFGLSGAWAQSKATGGAKTNGYFGSMSLAVGPGTIYATYRKDKVSGGGGIVGQQLPATYSGVADVSSEQGIGLAYLHGLSKRTFVYLAGGYGKQTYAAAASAAAPASAGTRRPIHGAIGVRHFF